MISISMCIVLWFFCKAWITPGFLIKLKVYNSILWYIQTAINLYYNYDSSITTPTIHCCRLQGVTLWIFLRIKINMWAPERGTGGGGAEPHFFSRSLKTWQQYVIPCAYVEGVPLSPREYVELHVYYASSKVTKIMTADLPPVEYETRWRK
jgi:hypothetical protein